MLNLTYLILFLSTSSLSFELPAKNISNNLILNIDTDAVKPSLKYGVQTFIQRCSLCHGPKGKGNGIIPQKLKNYPSTNLLKPVYSSSRKDIHRVVIYGGSQGEMSNFMPPMGNDLTWTQLESVVDLVVLLRNDNPRAMKLLESMDNNKLVSRRLGQEIFSNRCVLCHGKYGEGDGRMARVIKTPPPFDLTASRMPDDYLRKIISEGGEFMGRSKQMPPWKNELNNVELESVIIYIKTIRD